MRFDWPSVRSPQQKLWLLGATLILLACSTSSSSEQLPHTEPLTWEGDLAARMVEGIGKYLERNTAASVANRESHWKRDRSSPESYTRSVQPNRDRLARILGVVDERVPPGMKVLSDISNHDTAHYRTIRWNVVEGLSGEGLLFEPIGERTGDVVFLPDCDLSVIEGPELEAITTLQARGFRVLVPVLVDRACTWSGHPEIRWTNQPHREFIYRAAYEMGRHIIGFEIQKILATVDAFRHDPEENLPVGLLGYGEGGLLALYAGALDPRIHSVGVSGYFQPRENLWSEPIYRNVWGLLEQFGDAEIASLIAPRKLILETAVHPGVQGPPKVEGRSGGAPGVISTPDFVSVKQEADRSVALAGASFLSLIQPPGGKRFSSEFVDAFAGALAGPPSEALRHSAPAAVPIETSARQRAFDDCLEFTQRLMREAPVRRVEFWSKADPTSLDTWTESTKRYRDYLWNEVIGKLPPSESPMNPRSRKVFDQPRFSGYEIVLDLYEDVFAYGILLIPKGIPEGESRPVVVCQHGLEGRPTDVADPDVNNPYYSQYACQLAQRGFITFSPQNPYIGGDDFRVLQRKANPLKLSLFSFITRQHERIIEWLRTMPSVDPNRIGFYGLSYGGKTAMRVPALLDGGYCLSICSADYNEWIWKNVSADSEYSYLFTGEYEMPEFDLGNTFNYAELSWLIHPRPFMVERGHHDGVAPDQWVAYEFARTFRRYSLMGLADRAEIEYFDGPHSIHGIGTFSFLHKHLNHPESIQSPLQEKVQ